MNPDTATYRAAARFYSAAESTDVPGDDDIIEIVEAETDCDATCDEPEQDDDGEWSWTGRIYDRETGDLVGEWWSDGSIVDVSWVRA